MSEQSAVWHALNTRHGRATLVTFAVGVFLVALAGIALACVPWKGQMKIATPGQGVTVHGDDTRSMAWCSGESYAPAEAHQGDEITVTVAETTECGGNNNKLAAYDEYDVTLSNPGGFVDDDLDGEYSSDDGQAWTRDCMYPIGTWSHHLGTLEVDGDGDGTDTYEIPDDGTVVDSLDFEATGVCVTSQDNQPEGPENQGNMAPLTIL